MEAMNMNTRLGRNVEKTFHNLEESAYAFMRKSLIDYYLEKRNYLALASLAGNEWKSYTITEPVVTWVWVTRDVKGDYFIPKEIFEAFSDKANNEYPEQLESIDREIDHLITEYLLNEKVHYFFPYAP
jgi:hypothetical protein